MNTEQLANLIGENFPGETDPGTIATALAAAGTPIKDSRRKMVGDIIAAVGQDATADLLTAMDAAAASNVFVKNAIVQLNATGLDISHPTVQATITAIPFTSEANRTAIAEIGIKPRTRWQEMGMDALPTLAEIQEAIDYFAFWDWWQQKFTTVSSLIRNGTITDVAGVVAEIQS